MSDKNEQEVAAIFCRAARRIEGRKFAAARDRATDGSVKVSKIAEMLSGSRATRFRKAKRIIETEGVARG